MSSEVPNYPGFSKMKDPKDLDTVLKPKGDKASSKRVDFVYFDEDAEFDSLGIESTTPIISQQFIDLDINRVKDEIGNYAMKSLEFAFDEKDFKRITLNRERNYVGMYTKLIILQAITTLMTKVYFSIPEPDRGQASSFKALEKAPTWTTAYLGTIFSDIGRFESEGIEYNFRNPLSLLRDLGDLFHTIWVRGPVQLPANNPAWEPQLITEHYMGIEQWDEVGRGITQGDPYPERVGIDIINRLFPSKRMTFRYAANHGQGQGQANQNHDITVNFDFDGSYENCRNFVRGLQHAQGVVGMNDNDFAANLPIAVQTLEQTRLLRTNRPIGNQGRLIDKRDLPINFSPSYSSFTIANDRFFESAKGRIHLHKNHTFTGGSRVQLSYSGVTEHHTIRGAIVDAYVMETDVSDYTPTEIGAATYHGMAYPIYRYRRFEFRNTDANYVVTGTLHKQMERLTVKKPSKK